MFTSISVDLATIVYIKLQIKLSTYLSYVIRVNHTYHLWQVYIFQLKKTPEETDTILNVWIFKHV